MKIMKSGELRTLSLQFEKEQQNRDRLKQTLGSYNEDTDNLNRRIAMDGDRLKTKNLYNRFRSLVKPALLVESIVHLFSQSIKNIDNNKIATGRRLAQQFVEEQGCDKLLRQFSTRSLYLSSISSLIEHTAANILEAIDKDNPESFAIDPSSANMNDFYSQLDTGKPDDVIAAIRTRTTDAVQEFIDNQTMDKINIQSALQDVKNQLDGVSNEAAAFGIEQRGKRNVYNIKDKRPKSVIECMVYGIAKNAYKNENVKSAYLNESTSKVDLESVLEDCETIYTFLETLSSSKMVDYDCEYIKKIVDSVK